MKYFLSLKIFCKRQQQYLIASLITLAVAVGAIGLREAGGLEALELKGFDYLICLRPAETPDDRIAIVEISEADIQRMGTWPWSDRIFAKLIARISAAKPAVIGIDKYLDLPVLEGRKDLISAIKQAGNVVNVTFLAQQNRKGVKLPQDLAQISDAGFVNIPTDPGLVVRRALLAVDYDSFAFRLAQIYLKKKLGKEIAFNSEKQVFEIDNKVVPRITPSYGGYRRIDASGYQILLNYRMPLGSMQHISSIDLLEGKVNPELLRDRIVIIGVTAVSLKDNYPTPFSTTGEEVMYGAEIHANIVSQLLSNVLDGRPFIQPWPNSWELLWILAWTIVGGTAAVFISSAGKNLGVLVLLSLVLDGITYWAFLQALWLPFFPALIGMGIANILVTGYQFSKEQAERRLLMGLFSRHVSKEVVEVIWARREEFLTGGRIAGQEVYVTVLFTDMRNFSTAVEAQAPGETLDWLNEYLGAIASEVLSHGGMVDKYIGDAVMAVFGVPIPRDREEERCRDAQNALTAAIEIAEKLSQMNAIYKAKGMPEVVTGIGINSGGVIAGSLGSRERLEYSVLGDAVNVAARLENLNKEVDGGKYHILISEETCKRLQGKFVTEFAGNFALKGRAAETAVYRVVGQSPQALPDRGG